MTIQTETHI